MNTRQYSSNYGGNCRAKDPHPENWSGWSAKALKDETIIKVPGGVCILPSKKPNYCWKSEIAKLATKPTIYRAVSRNYHVGKNHLQEFPET